MNIDFETLSLLLRILEIPGSILGTETVYFACKCPWFFSVPDTILGRVDRTLAHPL